MDKPVFYLNLFDTQKSIILYRYIYIFICKMRSFQNFFQLNTLTQVRMLTEFKVQIHYNSSKSLTVNMFALVRRDLFNFAQIPKKFLSLFL